jgi:hypothetical protein
MKKKFKILVLSFIILSFFAGNVFASGKTCKAFLKAINDNGEEYQSDFLPTPRKIYINPGYSFEVFWDESLKKKNKWITKYTEDGNLTVDKLQHSQRNKEIKGGFELISIDGISVKSKELYLYNLFDYFDKAFEEDREIELKLKDLDNKILVYKTKLFKFSPVNVSSNLVIKSINYIDQINGKFEVFLENNLIYTYLETDGLYLAAKKFLNYTNKKEKSVSLTCEFTLEEWKSTGAAIASRNYEFENLRKIDQDQIETTVKIKLLSKERGYSGNFLKITSSQEGNLIFNNDFNLRSFPFDRQTLKIKLYDNFYLPESRLLFSSSNTMRDLDYFWKNKKINGWDIIGAESDSDTYKDPNQRHAKSAMTIKIPIERKHGYYIFKVIFPIILILMVCWSVVWVDPKELEARLTITIVCLLSLIAYNFVIDSELPKLEYLTVLDWIVLTSYIYATVPNFLSIISFRLQKTNLKLSKKLETLSKRYGLSSYMLGVFLIIMLNANLNPENSSSLISWISLR